jgi:TolB-like protein
VAAASAGNSFSHVNSSGVFERIDESLWKKLPDMTIIDAYQQEFIDKSFDILAADSAREIALSESLVLTSVNPSDRNAVRQVAEKEGANFVARGEVRIVDMQHSKETGNFEITAQIGVEIVDVNSGDVVSSYSNTATAASKSAPNARVQAIKKVAIISARNLAEQTINTWKVRSESGRQYVIEINNIFNARRQKRAIMDVMAEINADVLSHTEPKLNTMLLRLSYKGDKQKLSNHFIDTIGSRPGFSENEFDGPFNEDGKIVFRFIKSK